MASLVLADDEGRGQWGREKCIYCIGVGIYAIVLQPSQTLGVTPGRPSIIMFSLAQE